MNSFFLDCPIFQTLPQPLEGSKNQLVTLLRKSCNMHLFYASMSLIPHCFQENA